MFSAKLDRDMTEDMSYIPLSKDDYNKLRKLLKETSPIMLRVFDFITHEDISVELKCDNKMYFIRAQNNTEVQDFVYGSCVIQV